MARGSTAAPPAPAPANPANMTANNALFLILFGMFLMATLLPVLISTLLRLAAILAAVLLAAAATNPSDQSFAFWLNEQSDPADLVPDTSLGVTKWFSAMYRTAKALVRNEPLSWRFHNVICFSVAFVPSRERYAFGIFGTWRWADESGDYVKALCRAPWVMKVSRGGSMSSLERYMMRGPGTTGSGSETPRRRRVREATGFQQTMSAESESHRHLRAKALQCKVRKDWKNAAVFFLEAAKATGATLTRMNYELEAAWCTLEEVDTFPDMQNELIRRIQNACESLATAGYFDEASRGLSELALRLKRRFPLDCKRTDFAEEVAGLYVQAKNIAEAGGSVHSAAENGLRAAQVYADACLWPLAEGCFEAVGGIRRANGQMELANESYGNAVLCRLGQLDMAGAEDMLNRFAEYMGDSHRPSDMDIFLSSLLKACIKWSPQILETASKRYDASHRLAPWQKKCISNLQEKFDNSDLR